MGLLLLGCLDRTGGDWWGGGPTPPAATWAPWTNPGDGEVLVLWTCGDGCSQPSVNYNIYYSMADTVSKENGTKISGVGRPPYTVTNLINGTKYYFVVTAYNSTGESPESTVCSAIPTSNPPPIPPSNMQWTWSDSTHTAIVLTWDKVQKADSYNFYHLNTSWVTKTTGIKITDVKSPALLTKVELGTPWYARITAVNSNDESAESFEFWGEFP